MNISCDHYKIFYHVAKYKSFTRAAEVLYSNQPNLTRAIKALENELGCILFERSNRGVRLTEDGNKLYEHIAIAFEHIQAGEEAISLKRSLQNGMVAIGASEIALRCYLLPILNDYHRLYPGVRIKILNVSTPQAMKMLDSQLVDLAVITTPLDTEMKFTQTKLRDFREVPVCGQAFHAAFEDTQVTIEQLADYPLISLAAGTSTYEYYMPLFLHHGCSFSPDIEAATADQILPLVEHNLGIGFVPEEFLNGADKDDAIRRISLITPLPPRSIVLVKKRHHSLPLPARELERMILSEIR